MNKLRIAMIGIKGIPAKWGGHEIYAEEVGKRLVQKGHEVTAFCYGNYNRDYKENEYEGIKIKKVFAGPYRSVESLVGSLSSILFISRRKFDIAHLHGYASFYFIPFIKKRGIKTLITAHMYDSAWNNPKFGRIARMVGKRAFELGIRNADFISAVATHIQQSINDQYGIPSEVMYSGISTRKRLSPNLITKKYRLWRADYILFLGRLDRIKQVDLLIRAFFKLKDCALKLVVAGGAADITGYEEELHRLARGNKNVIFTGFVQGDLKDELLSNTAFLVSPSLNEGLPITVVEAASYGKACLVSDIPGHREVIPPVETFLIFKKDDFDDFYHKLHIMSTTPFDKLETIGERLYESVQKKFNWDFTSSKIEAAYYRLIGEGTSLLCSL